MPLWAGMIALIIAVFASLSHWWALALQTTPFLSDEPYSEMRNRHYAAQYNLFSEGEVVQLTGVIALGATRDLRDLLQTHPDVTRINLARMRSGFPIWRSWKRRGCDEIALNWPGKCLNF
ncbi:hypothetical protein AKJ29_02900 [Aliiroseovarius crassostreae]|uniref:Uncharacterized protein n=2 Tax=Aliiroseovarius crassostreae TaxID=154981 RepID=A0A0P7KI61_9RHOB|nr:hypothetical protein AKJ29_02900 [Aliiroseovarius crassostreae]